MFAIGCLYTETAKMLALDATEVIGHEAIQMLWQAAMDDGVKDLTLDAIDVEACGDLAYKAGSFSIQVRAENDARRPLAAW